MIEYALLAVIFLAALAWIVYRYEVRLSEGAEELALLKRELETRTPTETCLRDVATVWLQSEKAIMVRCCTISSAQDFHRWLRNQVTEAGLRFRREQQLDAIKNGPVKPEQELNVAHK